MANTGERSINIVSDNKPKMLKGLSQKGQRSGYKDFSLPCHGHSTLPVERALLTHSFVMAAEHGNCSGPQTVTHGPTNKAKMGPHSCPTNDV